jgi:two-component system, chemotaxis family, response regulator Rcp1
MRPKGQKGRLELLLVEDNPADARLVKEAFSDFPINLHVTTNGLEALKFLRRENGQGGAPRPDLVLLDLNMPRMDGRELLRVIKEDESLRPIPVLVLTTTESRRDINLAYRLGASCFLTKPADLDDFFSLMTAIKSFWGECVMLPTY